MSHTLPPQSERFDASLESVLSHMVDRAPRPQIHPHLSPHLAPPCAECVILAEEEFARGDGEHEERHAGDAPSAADLILESELLAVMGLHRREHRARE